MNIKLLLSLALLGSLGTAYGMQKRVTYGQFTFQNQLPSPILNTVKIGDSIIVENVPYRMNPRAPLYLTDAKGNQFAKNTKATYGGTSKNPGNGVLTYTVTALPYRTPQPAPAAAASPVAPRRTTPQAINTPVTPPTAAPLRTIVSTQVPAASPATRVTTQPTLNMVNATARINRPNPYAVPAPTPAPQTQTPAQAPVYPYAQKPSLKPALARIERALPSQPQRETITPQRAITQLGQQPQTAQNMVFESEETTLKFRQPSQIATITHEPASAPQYAKMSPAIRPQVVQEAVMPTAQYATLTKKTEPQTRIQLTPFQQDLARDMGRLFRRTPASQVPAPVATPQPAAQPSQIPVVPAQPANQEPILPTQAPVVNNDEQEAIAELERLMNEITPWNAKTE